VRIGKRIMAKRKKNRALFIRCTGDEAERIRKAAKAERKTMSGFVLNAVMNHLNMREKMLQQDTGQALRRSATSSSS
jgi:uncharacterized protein (DUF1778 family)